MGEEFSGLKIVLTIILCIAILFIICWFAGAFDVFYDRTIGLEHANVQRENFENSESYVKGMINDLAKYKYEFETEKDVIAKKAIVDLVVGKFSDFPEDKIKDNNIKTWLNDIKSGKYSNLEEKK